MKMTFLQQYLLFLALLFIGNINAQTPSFTDSESIVPLYTDEEVRMRLRKIASCIIPRYTAVVKSYINTYTIKNRDKTEAMLGKAVMYFPLFHKYIKDYGFPDAIKYLSVTESALNPTAVSSAKAVGLWQFMPVTAKEYGLRIDHIVDERCDPHLSTDAAMRYLRNQYKRFGDWTLAIAAYNSGGGSVSRAIRRGRSKNFWKIRKYLPRETRNYVPAYIAAAYLLQNYEKHNLNPVYPEMDLQLTSAVKVYEALDFNQISIMTGLSLETIRALNPAYIRDYIPASSKGRFLILPKRVMNDFKSHFVRPDSHPANRINQSPSGKKRYKADYAKSYYTVQLEDDLSFLADLFNCDPYHLKFWNNLKTDEIKPGQELMLFTPDYENAITIIETNTAVEALPTLKLKAVYPLKGSVVAHKEGLVQKPKKYLYHTIQRNESLKDIATKYRIPIPILLKINGIKNNKLPKPGNRIKVKVIN